MENSSQGSAEQIQKCLDRLQAGDSKALEDLFHVAQRQLLGLVEKMFTAEARLQRWEQSEDVLQKTLLRLWTALDSTRPKTVREFFGLSALQIRRELIDLARHYFGPQGIGSNYESVIPADKGESASFPPFDPADHYHDPDDLVEKWARFHELVEILPSEEREVTSLIYYHDWKRKDVDELLNISEKTVTKSWKSATEKIQQLLAD